MILTDWGADPKNKQKISTGFKPDNLYIIFVLIFSIHFYNVEEIINSRFHDNEIPEIHKEHDNANPSCKIIRF